MRYSDPHRDSRLWLWVAVILLSATIAQLAFHVRTETTPNSAFTTPPWFAIAISMGIGFTAYRSSGMVRVGVGLIALSLLLGTLVPLIGVKGWVGWSVRSTFTVFGSLLLIAAVRPSARVRLVTVAAGVMLIAAALYMMQRVGYDMWLRATKQNSVMSP
jgi:peptidoglycan/LPS O-acetylase OafA/YrhL